MAKVFRLHQGSVGTGWFNSAPITTQQLQTILTNGKDVASSIPSPFARIDLVKSAFSWVATNGIDGNSSQHQLVSDALDVAQLFFEFPKHQKTLGFKIVAWDPKLRFNEMKLSSLNTAFVETLEVYWNQDASVYNLNNVQRLYFILNAQNEVIGGTSPSTLFFAAPDVRVATQNNSITCGSDVLFDTTYTSLHQRDQTFIEYLFTFSKQANFAILFPEVFAYLQTVQQKLDLTLKVKIANLIASDLHNYNSLSVLGNTMNACEILGIPLGVKPINPLDISAQSDFVIKSDYLITDLPPLVLPDAQFTQNWTYTTNGVLWDKNYRIPPKNKNLNLSILPIQGDHYPWLSAGNFLEDKIIELPYSFDGSKFVTCGSKKHLLPLSPTFIQYFITENVSKYLKLENLSGGGIQATLDIPVKNGKITFKKNYHREDIIKLEIHLAILPFIRTTSIDLDYTLGLQDKRFDRTHDIFIECYQKSNIINLSNPVVRKQGERNTIKSIYYKAKYFDCIKVGSNSIFGFIIPTMPESGSNQQVSFAIDFGTTNTHIEYKCGLNAEKAIDTTSDLPMWQSLIDKKLGETQDIADDNNYEREIFPYQFNNETNYKFPFRTALTYNQNTNFNESVNVFTHTNNFFLFEKIFYSTYIQLHTKLKWSNYNNSEDKILVRNYIECLVYLTLYKTLLLNANPQTTKITWFYPVSMDSFEQGIFFDVWQRAYKKIFKVENTNNINAIPESIAPYLHYRTLYPGLSLSIDIGGGSSDIAVFRNASNLPEFISSFKFAGNAIFGDGFPNGAFTNSSDNNGFVKSYRKAAERAIGTNANKNEILSDILDKRKDSADFSSFLFALENEKDVNINYTELLKQDRKMKLPILVFYGAIIYYSANLIKRYGMTEIPKNILLSGTAAKTLKILDSQRNYPNITALFKYIFKKVIGQEVSQISVALSENPKEITCKGVLRADIDNDITNCNTLFWLGGSDDSIWSKALNKNVDIPNTPFYADLEIQDNKNRIENSINDYFTLLDSYLSNINLEGDFGIDNSAYLKFKEMRSLNIQDFLEQGIKAFFKAPDKHIEEPLFFYPLIGILNKLSLELAYIEKQ